MEDLGGALGPELVDETERHTSGDDHSDDDGVRSLTKTERRRGGDQEEGKEWTAELTGENCPRLRVVRANCVGAEGLTSDGCFGRREPVAAGLELREHNLDRRGSGIDQRGTSSPAANGGLVGRAGRAHQDSRGFQVGDLAGLMARSRWAAVTTKTLRIERSASYGRRSRRMLLVLPSVTFRTGRSPLIEPDDAPYGRTSKT